MLTGRRNRRAARDAGKEVANVRRYRNQYEAALVALDIADRAMDDQPVTAHD